MSGVFCLAFFACFAWCIVKGYATGQNTQAKHRQNTQVVTVCEFCLLIYHWPKHTGRDGLCVLSRALFLTKTHRPWRSVCFACWFVIKRNTQAECDCVFCLWIYHWPKHTSRDGLCVLSRGLFLTKTHRPWRSVCFACWFVIKRNTQAVTVCVFCLLIYH